MNRLEDMVARAYGIIGTATPIKADCGKLCGAACCKDAIEDGNSALGESGGFGPQNESDTSGVRYASGAPESDAPGPQSESGAPGPPIESDTPGPPSESGAPESDVPGPPSESGAPDSLGMILFPGEINLLSQEPGYRFFRIPYMGGRVWFLICEGVCNRRKRPLACRIFPLAPHIDEDGRVRALPDPRAGRVCPLADGERLDPAFRRAVVKAFRYLAGDPEMLGYMRLLSAELDDMRTFIYTMKGVNKNGVVNTPRQR